MQLFKGLLLKWNFWRPPQDKKCFDDQAFWEVGNQDFFLQANKYLAADNPKTVLKRCYEL